MAVLYKLYQDNRSNATYPGKWYARAVHNNVTDLNAIAALIQRNCSLKKSDVIGVLTEMVEVMRDELTSSNIVKLDGLGTFRVGLSTKPADTAAAFTPAKNVVGYRVNFLPEAKLAATSVATDGKLKRTLVKNLIEGVTCKEATKNAVVTEKAPTEEKPND